jgi:hypothetical protein
LQPDSRVREKTAKPATLHMAAHEASAAGRGSRRLEEHAPQANATTSSSRTRYTSSRSARKHFVSPVVSRDKSDIHATPAACHPPSRDDYMALLLNLPL